MVYLQRWHGWCHMKLLPSRRVMSNEFRNSGQLLSVGRPFYTSYFWFLKNEITHFSVNVLQTKEDKTAIGGTGIYYSTVLILLYLCLKLTLYLVFSFQSRNCSVLNPDADELLSNAPSCTSWHIRAWHK